MKNKKNQIILALLLTLLFSIVCNTYFISKYLGVIEQNTSENSKRNENIQEDKENTSIYSENQEIEKIEQNDRENSVEDTQKNIKDIQNTKDPQENFQDGAKENLSETAEYPESTKPFGGGYFTILKKGNAQEKEKGKSMYLSLEIPLLCMESVNIGGENGGWQPLRAKRIMCIN